jgi:hypothetical protein
MRKLKLSLMLAFLATMLWSCKDSTQTLTNAIPQDAVMVFQIDSKSLLQKADWKPTDNPSIKQSMDEMKASLSEEQGKLLEDFLKNPNSATGVDVLGDYYFYMDKQQVVGILFKMNDAKKFKQLLTESGELPAEMFVEENGITTLDLGGQPIAWTEDKILILTNPQAYANPVDLTALVKKQLAQPADSSINAQKSFGEFIAAKKDISIYYNYDELMDMYGEVMSDLPVIYRGSKESALFSGLQGIFGKAVGDFKGMDMGIFISFEKGGIEMKGQYYYASAEDEERIAALYEQMTGEIKGEHLKYFAEKPLFSAAFSLKGEGLYNYMETLGVMNLIDADAQAELDSMGIDIKAIASNVEGDVTLALNGFPTVTDSLGYSKEIPEFTIFTDYKDAQSILKLITSKTDSLPNVTKIDDNTYSILADDILVYWGAKGNTIYATNSKAIFDNITAGKLTDNDFAAMAKGKSSFAFGNLSALRNMSELTDESDAETQALVTKGFDLLGDYYFFSNADMAGEGKFVITDDSKNSLAIIVSYVESWITQLTGI